jgi:hypothetical protein
MTKKASCAARWYPSGRTVQFNYPAGAGITTDRLASIADNATATTVLGNIQHVAAGQISSQTYGNGAVGTRSRNTRNQITGFAASYGAASLMNLTYDYGTNNGRIRTRMDFLQPEHSVQYSYDAMKRLTGVTGTSLRASGPPELPPDRTQSIIIDCMRHGEARAQPQQTDNSDFGASRLRAANSSTALICSRVTGNCR